MLDNGKYKNFDDLINNLDAIRNKNYLTHGIHPYPAKFIPQIPSCAIETYSTKSDIILDPFCGSGTALLEGLIRSRKAIGIDVNPIATLISKVKTNLLTKNENAELLSTMRVFLGAIEDIDQDAKRTNYIEDASDIPNFKNRDHWFQKNVQKELAYIRKIIESKSINPNVNQFLRLCFSSIIVKVSNQDSETRWKATDKKIPSGFTLKAFYNAVAENFKRMKELNSILPQEHYDVDVHNKPIEELGHVTKPLFVDLVITSPPYLNSFDYYLYHKLRMFWLGYDHKTVQKQELGSRYRHCDKGESVDSFKQSMSLIMEMLYKTLKTEGKCVLIVGDSIYKGELIDMGKLYREIAQPCGFRLIEHKTFSQRKYSRSFTPNMKQRHKSSHIIVFER